MKVFVGPRTDLGAGGIMAQVARSLAGPEGPVLSLRDLGARNLTRRLSAAEVASLRQAFGRDDPVIGYVCRGVAVGAAAAGTSPVTDASMANGTSMAAVSPPAVVALAVDDHAGLTWCSPLTGPNDDAMGPRFPSLAGCYAPEAVVDRLAGHEGIIVRRGIVAGVADDGALSDFEAEVMAGQGWTVATEELVAPVIIAAHMGLRVAAVVLVA